MTTCILAIDQGTTSTRAIAFELRDDGGLHPVAISQIALQQHFPASGWVEHDAAEIWTATLQTCREVIAKAGGIGLGRRDGRAAAPRYRLAGPAHRRRHRPPEGRGA